MSVLTLELMAQQADDRRPFPIAAEPALLSDDGLTAAIAELERDRRALKALIGRKRRGVVGLDRYKNLAAAVDATLEALRGDRDRRRNERAQQRASFRLLEGGRGRDG